MNDKKTKSESTKHELALAVTREDSPLCFRQSIAVAKGDGFDVEIAANIGDGNVLVTIKRENEKGWFTYALSPHALADAVLKLDDELREESNES